MQSVNMDQPYTLVPSVATANELVHLNLECCLEFFIELRCFKFVEIIQCEKIGISTVNARFLQNSFPFNMNSNAEINLKGQ